ncbi:MAG: G5 domain-containing protein [Clostridiales bacterium]|nr:G5 domain-containing protein [Clostridiales bacterium]MDY4060548.1 G5 domain-containing protein [Anaerovoracaceae bacterium]
MSESFSKRKNRYAVIGGILIALLLFMTVMVYSSKAYASEEYWAIQAGGKTLAVVSSESEAEKVIDGVKKAYITEGAKVESIKTDKDFKAVNQRFKDGKAPRIVSSDKAVDTIKKGAKAAQKYQVKDGDTTWDIASSNNLGYEELISMNKGMNPENIMPGDELTIEKEIPYVNVTTVEVLNKTEAIAPEVQYEDTDELYDGETKVKQEGTEGSKDLTLRQTTVNGAIQSSETLKENVTKESTPQIVLRGTKARPQAAAGGGNGGGGSSSYSVPSGAGYSGSGASIAAYATQFVGYPYVWGGSNLSTGVDCGGFIVAVYRGMGYNIGRSFASYGRTVPVSAMQPGDIIHYGSHVSIYIGGGQEIHALNPNVGVVITGLGGACVGPIQQVIRIVE